MKIAVLLLCLVGVAGLIYGAKYLYDFKVYKSIISSINIANIDFAKIKDGVYMGELDAKLVAVKQK